jgi:ribosomal protein S18 acetylase RimI-like enzyme
LSRTAGSSFDPSLWFLAWDGAEIAGMALCTAQPDKGYIQTVAVRRAWRGRGLGLALLEAAFGTYYERGTRHIELSVDSESPTGAARLYERAGMYPSFTVVLYEKEIRPGRDPIEDVTA